MSPNQTKSIIASAAIAAITRHHSLARAATVGLLALGLGAANHATAGNLLVNGSFESNTVTDNGGQFALISAGNPSPQLPGWNVPHEIYWLYRNYGGVTAQDGSQWLGPQASTGDVASQNFSVVAGNTYEVSWYSQYRPNNPEYVGAGTAAITLAAGAATGTTTMTTAEDASWTRYSFSFTPDTTTTATLTLSASSGIPYFDNVVVTDVSGKSTSPVLKDFSYNPVDGAAEVSIQGVAGTRYKLVEADDLDFSNPGQNPIPLTDATVGTLDSNDVVIADESGNATVRFNLGTTKPATFIRAEITVSAMGD